MLKFASSAKFCACVVVLLLVEHVASQHAHFSTGWTPGYGIGKRERAAGGIDCATRADTLYRMIELGLNELRRMRRDCLTEDA